MRKRLFIALILILMLVPMSSVAAKDKPLKFETTYVFAYNPDKSNCELPIPPFGRCLVWTGNVSGTFNGQMEWWMHFPEGMVPTGKVNHWKDAQWIIYPDEGGYIIGSEWGSTTMLPENAQKGAIWRANGIVTEASLEFEYLIGRPIHDGGVVDWGPPPSGTGKFQIN